MTLDIALKTQLIDMLSKARRSLKAARRHLGEGDYDFAASRAYYGAFYAMEAALLAKGVTCSTHGGVLTEFSKYFYQGCDVAFRFRCKSSKAVPGAPGR